MTARLRRWVAWLRAEAGALYLAYRDPRTPWYAKALAFVVAAYAFSPLDLIPDVIPVLGYLDDALLVPLGIVLAVRLIPRAVMAECRERVRAGEGPRSRSRAGLVLVLVTWLLAAGLAAVILYRLVG